MAKSRSSKQASTGALSVPGPKVEIVVGGQLGIDDVLAIATSRAEQKYATEVARCRTEIREAAEECDRLRKEALATAKDAVTKAHEVRLAAVQKALAPIGGKATFSTGIQHVSHLLQCCGDGDDPGNIESTIAIRKAGEHSGYGGTSLSLSCIPPKRVKTLLAKAKEADERRKELESEALQWRRQQQNVPMLERKYRARIAEQRLEACEGGQELLEALTSDLDETILALPG